MRSLPPQVREALEVVLTDLQQPTPVDLRFDYEVPPDGPSMLMVRERGTAGRTGVPVWPELAAAELQVHIAEQLQEQVFPESEGAWGEARPACPGHGHPARPEELSGQAWWTCPADGRRIAPIGSLES